MSYTVSKKRWIFGLDPKTDFDPRRGHACLRDALPAGDTPAWRAGGRTGTTPGPEESNNRPQSSFGQCLKAVPVVETGIV